MITGKPFRGTKLNKAHPLATGMISCLIMNNRPGRKVINLASQRTLDFDAAYPPSWKSEGVEFDSTREHIDWMPSDDIPSQGTILFFYRWTNVSSSYYYFFHSDQNWDSFALLNNASDEELDFLIYGTTICRSTAIGKEWIDGQPHTIGVTWDLVSGDGQVIYDNQIYSDNNSVLIPANGYKVNLGGRSDNDNRYCGGIISTWLAWNRVLSETEIKEIQRDPYQILNQNYFGLLTETVVGATAPTGNLSGPFGGPMIGAL